MSPRRPISLRWISVEKAEAEVGIAEAALKKAQVALRDAEDDEQRKRKLTATGASSAVELSKAIAARGLAAAEVQNAAAAVDKSKAELKQARLDLERSQARGRAHVAACGKHKRREDRGGPSVLSPVKL